jgi:hypothetical protein
MNNFSDIVASNNGSYGVYLNYKSNNNVLNGVTATNNGSGIGIGDNSNLNWLSGIVASNNAGLGIAVGSSGGNKIGEVVASNNGSYGVFISSVSSIILSNAAAVNNYDGVNISNSTYATVIDVAATNNSNYGVYVSNASYGYFSGLLKVGGNAVGDCYVTSSVYDPGIDDDANPLDVSTESPEVHSGLCTQQGTTSDFGAAVTGTSLAASFTGKVTADDISNASDSNGYAASYPAAPASFDWTTFDNPYRGWGLDGSAFPFSDHRGRWTTGAGRIWDWSLSNADVALKDTHTSLPTGNELLYSTSLRRAVELDGDGIGDDDTLCESNETCLFTPNVGAYQGHGSLVTAGTFTDGTVTGVTLMKYGTNGY